MAVSRMNSVLQRQYVLSGFSTVSEGTGYFEDFWKLIWNSKIQPVLTDGIID
jgi:hypothetical protein